MKPQNPALERIRLDPYGIPNNGAFLYRAKTGAKLKIIASDGGGWDHVSVSLPHRCPTWEEMAEVKDLFFDAEETVIQMHPPRSQYVNRHPYCLHLWKPHGVDIPLPPMAYVG